MSRISILKRSIRTARVGLVLVAMLSPAHGAYQRDAVSVLPVMPKGAAADHSPVVLTAHLPWLAPVGHRQPRQADVPQSDAVSSWERQRLQADQELDHKLIICRGC
jgi:hypothetical protein